MANYDITALDTRTEYFSAGNGTSASCRLTDTRVLVAYRDNVNDGFARAYDVNRSTGVFTGLSSAHEFDNADCTQLVLERIDDTHALAVYRGTSNDGFAVILTINAGTGAVTSGTKLEFDTADLQYPTVMQWDSTHFLVVWQGTTNGKSQILTVNTGAGTITAEGSATNIGSNLYAFTGAKISNDKAFIICAGTVDEDVKSVILAVNTSTWATSVTTSAAVMKTATANSPAVCYLGTSGSDDVVLASYRDGTSQKIRTYNVNTSTWVVSTRGAEYNTTNSGLQILSSGHGFIQKIDSTHAIMIMNVGDGSTAPTIKTYGIDSSSGDITALGSTAIGAGTTDVIKSAIQLHDMNSNYWLGSWHSDVDDGDMAQLFKVVLSTDYPITAAQGSYTLTGQAVAYHLGRKMLAAFGSYTYTGYTTGVKFGRKMAAALGTFALTGQAVSFFYGKLLVAAYGAFTLTGQAVSLTSVRRMTMGVGNFALTGIDTALRYGYRMAAAYGSYVLTGITTLLRSTRKLIAAQGSFTLTGQAVAFARAAKIFAVTGYFTLTGGIVTFLKNGTSVVLINATKIATSLTNAVKAAATSLTNRPKQ